MEQVKKDYHYRECGLQTVILKGLTVNVCPACGAEEPEILSVEVLHRLIMFDLLKKRSLLCGEEIRFLRKMSRMKATELAILIDATTTTLSKWENNERKIGSKSDRVIRLVCYTALLERLVKADSEERLTGTVARAALTNERLNVFDLLRKIEDKAKGPKRMSIDPTKIGGDCVDIEKATPVAGIQ